MTGSPVYTGICVKPPRRRLPDFLNFSSLYAGLMPDFLLKRKAPVFYKISGQPPGCDLGWFIDPNVDHLRGAFKDNLWPTLGIWTNISLRLLNFKTVQVQKSERDFYLRVGRVKVTGIAAVRPYFFAGPASLRECWRKQELFFRSWTPITKYM